MKQANGSPILLPAAAMPISGMKMMVSNKNGMLTIEFDRQISWLQFNSVDAKRFVKGLADHIKAMDAS